MRSTLERANYHTPTPIQEQTLEPLMNGRDLVGVAQTGTGKTAAFVIPIVERIQPENRKVQALILCPTRELALQTTSVIKKLSAHLPIRTVSVYGAVAQRPAAGAPSGRADRCRHARPRKGLYRPERAQAQQRSVCRS